MRIANVLFFTLFEDKLSMLFKEIGVNLSRPFSLLPPLSLKLLGYKIAQNGQ